MYTYVIVVGNSATKRSTEILKRGGLFLLKTSEKLDLLLRVNNLSDPDMDIREVRAIGKKRMNLYPFRPYDVLIESLEHRHYTKVFQNNCFCVRTLSDEPSRVSLTSSVREEVSYYDSVTRTLKICRSFKIVREKHISL